MKSEKYKQEHGNELIFVSIDPLAIKNAGIYRGFLMEQVSFFFHVQWNLSNPVRLGTDILWPD